MSTSTTASPLETTESPEPNRFVVFAGHNYWVLRDLTEKLDYPFLSEAAAYAGIAFRADHPNRLLGSPTNISAYGEPIHEEMAA